MIVKKNIEGVEVSFDDEIFYPEAIEKITREKNQELKDLIRVEFNLFATYTQKAPPFERIRRITGYLTGDLNTWNNAKRAEESDRVKHCCNG